ncbi:FAD-dependent urate hydroxylase [Melia azedarach]|uniref:FAD-dependent urate hydroxylase n=1 Tax=Melia azedarach TaxID=155640 RepID=A0ACC1XVY8_MELAZ|nr:FAD-dependent urate hydroxylase [Melia azedarach]
MASAVEEEVVVVGGGIAGLATATALKRVGVRALVLEKSEKLRATGAALTIFPNGWLALDSLGVSHKLTPLYSPTKRALITDIGTGATQEVSFTGPQGTYTGPRSVHRRILLEALADELPIESIRFSSKVASIETQTQEGSSIAIIHLEDGASIKTKILIGCDGVHSVVARWLGLGAPVSSGRSAVRGLAVFPQGHGLSQEYKQFVGVGKKAGFIPLSDKDIYWWFTCESTTTGENMPAGNPELIQREVIQNYAKDFPPFFHDIVGHSDLSTISWTPLLFRYPWDIMFGNLSKGNITVAGDAMHPMTPELSQGGSAALEDAVVLARHIGNSLMKNGRLDSGEVAGAIDEYIKERKWRVTWLVAGSYLSGWVQIGGRNKWWMKFFRDVIFYRIILVKIVSAVNYDCGKLPSIS